MILSKLESMNKIILDGGMGQSLLKRGMKPNGSLWSSSALLNEKSHKLIEDLHIDFINSGSSVIVTNNFTVRDRRLLDNDLLGKKEFLLNAAGKIASNAVKKSNKNTKIAGSIPTQGETYSSEIFYPKEEMSKLFFDTANILNPYVDFFYLDVFCSIKEIFIALDQVNKFNKPILVGAHFKKNGLLPSGENISLIKPLINKYNLMGVIGACISPETYKKINTDLMRLNLPYGFKVNAFDDIPDDWNKSVGSNPNEELGLRKDFTPQIFKSFVEEEIINGASIIGGCCETHPEHIAAISN